VKSLELNESQFFVANLPKLLELFYRFERNIFLLFTLHNGQDLIGWSLLKFGLDDYDQERYILNLGDHSLDWWMPPINFELIHDEEMKMTSEASNRTIEPPKRLNKKAGFKIFLELFSYSRDDMDQYIYKDKRLEDSEDDKGKKSSNLTGTLTQSLMQDTVKSFFKRNGKSEISNEIDIMQKKKLNNKSIESAYIPCQQQYLSKERFQGGEVEVYIDQIRFLPSNVTNVKMLVRIIDKDFNGKKDFSKLY
jgi:hypothetical protein